MRIRVTRYDRLFRLQSQAVEGTAHAAGSPVQQLGVDHRGPEVGVPEEFLDRSDVLPILKEVCGEGVSEGMARGALRDSSLPDGCSNGPLRYRGVAVMPSLLPCCSIDPARPLGEDPLPLPLAWGGRVLSTQCVGELHASESVGEVLSMHVSCPRQLLPQRFSNSGW